MHRTELAVLFAVWTASPGRADTFRPDGLVVEAVRAGFAAHKAGLKPGDVLLAWERAASPPANPEPGRGRFRSPFDPLVVEKEEVARGRFDVSEGWTQQIGSTAPDVPSGIAVNATGVYVAGVTLCQLAGQISAGSADAVVIKLNR